MNLKPGEKNQRKKMESQLKSQIEDEEKNNQDAKIFGKANEIEVAILKKLSTYHRQDNESLRKRDSFSEKWENNSKEYKDLWQKYFHQYINVYV
jgi:hypothetical protein